MLKQEVIHLFQQVEKVIVMLWIGVPRTWETEVTKIGEDIVPNLKKKYGITEIC